jgi:hypothetical protein
MTTRTRPVRRLALAFACLGALLAATAPNASAVVGGKPADPADYPFLAVVGGGCGGALIAPDRVLTAAHCRDVLIDERYVRVGPGLRRVGVRRIAIHPVNLRDAGRSDASPAPADFMVLELASPVLDVAPLEIASAPPAAGTSAVTIGRGTTNPRKNPDGKLRSGGVVIQSDADCRKFLRTAAFRTWFTCVRDPRSLVKGSKGPFVSGCFGDSGSPLLVRDGARWVSVGVDSWGPACGTERDPEVYADIVKGRDFALAPKPLWAPAPARRPVISGAARVGSVVRCAVTFLDTPRKATYDFSVGGDIVARDGGPRYRVRSRDRGKKLSCLVVAQGPGGTEVASSRPVRVSG